MLSLGEEWHEGSTTLRHGPFSPAAGHRPPSRPRSGLLYIGADFPHGSHSGCGYRSRVSGAAESPTGRVT